MSTQHGSERRTRVVVRREFRSIDPATARVVLLEAGPAVLPSSGEQPGGSARRRLGESRPVRCSPPLEARQMTSRTVDRRE